MSAGSSDMQPVRPGSAMCAHQWSVTYRFVGRFWGRKFCLKCDVDRRVPCPRLWFGEVTAKLRGKA